MTPPPTGQHPWAQKRLIRALDDAIRHSERDDLDAVGGVGVENRTDFRTALVPDVVVLNMSPVGASFQADQVLLAGAIWSPGHTHLEQRPKFDACARAGIPFFRSVTQDRQGPTELAAYELVGIATRARR